MQTHTDTDQCYTFPARKTSTTFSAPGSPISPRPTPSIHSPLSPLTDGALMTPLWSTKYLDVVPSVLLTFFPFGDVPGVDDEQLIHNINSTRDALTVSKYKCKFVVVLVGNASESVEDRLLAVRKAVRLDTKSTFFYIPARGSTGYAGQPASSVEAILAAIRPASLEYYRDVSKQVRRKRDRGGPTLSPFPEETQLHTIPRSAWTARYEYKSGFLAEARSEMVMAVGHYNAGLDALFDTGGVFYTLSNWSPNWNAARMFADCIAIHQLRCYLANGEPTEAARFWLKYHGTLQQVLDAKGKGTASYGWKVWQARWACVMAELIRESPAHPVDLLSRKAIESLFRDKQYAYAPMERSAGLEDPYNPFDFLHHPGYWLVLSSTYTRARRNLVLKMPESDRTPPGQSPSSKVARRQEIYDTYMCLEPHEEWPVASAGGVDYSQLIVDVLEEAIDEFVHRGQPSMASRLRLTVAKELVNASRWDEALGSTKALWPGHKWRRSGWWEGVGQVASLLYRSAEAVQDRSSQIRALCELMSRRFDAQETIHYDLMALMSLATKSEGTKEEILLRHEDIVMFLDISFAFAIDESHAGETVQAQITLTSNAQVNSAPVIINILMIELEGEVKSIDFRHCADNASASEAEHQLVTVDLKALGRSDKLMGDADLALSAGTSKVYTISLGLREAGSIRAVRAFATIEAPHIIVRYSQSLQSTKALTNWWFPTSDTPRKRLAYHKSDVIRVHPKLPKVHIHFLEVLPIYYTDEHIDLHVDLINQEIDDVEMTLEIRVPGHENLLIAIRGESQSEQQVSGTGSMTYTLGTVKAASNQKLSLGIQLSPVAGNIAIEIKAIYHLLSDRKSPLTKTSSTTLNVVAPFDAEYTLRPDLHPEAWPSFFAHSNLPSEEEGITTRWSQTTTLISLATERLIVEKVELRVENVSDGAECAVIASTVSENIPLTLSPRTQHDLIFTLDTHRLTLDDLRTTAVTAILVVYWRRATSTAGIATAVITSLPIPSFRLPTSEPRALASLAPSADESTILLDITLENPSMHYLSFQCSLDPNEDFAFSGRKVGTVHLVPLSRMSVRYTLLPFGKVGGTWIRPVVRVVDVHFDKSLTVHGTGEVQRDDERSGLRIWVDG
jgi:hypothetical protein